MVDLERLMNGVKLVREIDEGVGVGGGAGSDHKSCGDVVEEVGDSVIVEGVGDGGGAGSTQSSCGEVVVGVIRSVIDVAGVMCVGAVG